MYLVAIYRIYPFLEPLHNLASIFLLLSFRRKILITILCLASGVLLIIGLKIWLLFPLIIIAVFLVAIYASIYLVFRRLFRYAYWSLNKQKLLEEYPGKHTTTIHNLGLAPEELRNLQTEIEKNQEAIIADIDKDGFLFSRYGQFAGASFVSQEDFIPRKRNKLHLIAVKDQVCVRKLSATMRGFLSEIDSLYTLREHCNVPAILGVEFRKYSIDVSFIPGVVLKQELANRGARIRHRDLDHDHEYIALNQSKKEAVKNRIHKTNTE